MKIQKMEFENFLKFIESAYTQIKSFIHQTPIIYSNSFSKMFSKNIYLKTENLQKTGSFKVRGALYKILKTKPKFVSTASMGNHAQGVAYSAQCFGIKATIVMPEIASLAKISATKYYGANVILKGKTLVESIEFAKKLQNHTFIHPYDDIDVICGQGSIGIEIIKDLPNITDILIPVGGGGLISGISLYLKQLRPKIRIIGIQTVSAKSGVLSFKNKKITPFEPLTTIADGIAVKQIGQLPSEIINKFVDDMVYVDEESIAKAILLLMERKKLVVEGAGAVSLAYLLENNFKKLGKSILLLLSGGNIDMLLMDKILFNGLMASKRIIRLKFEISDLYKQLNEIIKLIFRKKGIIKNIQQEAILTNISNPKYSVNFIIETKGEKHAEELKKIIIEKGYKIIEGG